MTKIETRNDGGIRMSSGPSILARPVARGVKVGRSLLNLLWPRADSPIQNKIICIILLNKSIGITTRYYNYFYNN